MKKKNTRRRKEEAQPRTEQALLRGPLKHNHVTGHKTLFCMFCATLLLKVKKNINNNKTFYLVFFFLYRARTKARRVINQFSISADEAVLFSVYIAKASANSPLMPLQFPLKNISSD